MPHINTAIFDGIKICLIPKKTSKKIEKKTILKSDLVKPICQRTCWLYKYLFYSTNYLSIYTAMLINIF
jgi:hypothetical protein